ncbi:MAG: MlaD family protein [Solirubrobacterales bacterium]
MRRSATATLAASPTMVGAVTTLIAIVAVFLAYNANNGLPFVPAYRVSVEVPSAARLTDNNEVRMGGVRIGVVESIEPVAVEGDSLTAAADPTDVPPEAQELPVTAAKLNLKLDKGSAHPLPQDSIFRIRYRSVFGLKYVEVVRGTGPPAPEGHVFTGTDDGELCELPTDIEGFESTSPAASRNGCFQDQTEFDEINDTFDNRTRKAQRENLVGFGNGLTGRGVSLNETISELPRLFENLKPVGRILSDPDTNLRRFIRGLERTARYQAPAALDYALSFAYAATAFEAITSDEEKLKEAIYEAPITYETGIRLLPAQREFLGNVERFARLMTPATQDLAATLPVLNDAIEFGTPVLRKAPPINRKLRAVFRELNQLVSASTTRLTLQRLGETFRTAKPLVRHVAPAQTVCNYWNYWFTNLPGGLSEPSHIGYSLRQALVRFPSAPAAEVGVGAYAGIGARGRAGPPSNQFRPYEFPIVNTHPYGPTGQKNADCQAGQAGYPLGRLRVPGQAADDPADRVSDIPGSRGPTTSFWDADQNRILFDSRVASRQPQTWDGVGP